MPSRRVVLKPSVHRCRSLATAVDCTYDERRASGRVACGENPRFAGPEFIDDYVARIVKLQAQIGYKALVDDMHESHCEDREVCFESKLAAW